MLGSIIQGRRWSWVAVGKHPAAKDYIHVGAHSPLLDAVAEWSAKGYRQLSDDNNQQSGYYSWRFWLKGIKKGSLVCGLGRDSSDSIGRPYPLLIMGEGGMRGWEKHWTMLPARLDKTWSRMEFVAAHRFDSASVMEEEVARLITPDNNTDQAVDPSQKDLLDLDFSSCKTQLHRDGFSMIRLNPPNGVDPNQLLLQCHCRLKECCSEIPTGVFIGGTPQQAYLAVILHPLRPQDFVRLWSC